MYVSVSDTVTLTRWMVYILLVYVYVHKILFLDLAKVRAVSHRYLRIALLIVWLYL